MAERITGHTELIGLMAYPIRHSSSPAMQNEAFAKLGYDYAYLAFEVGADEIEDAVKAIRTLKMRGSNVSMPNKTLVGKYLDELSPAAELCGAVNTIVNDNGHLTGHITDGIGFMSALKDNDIDVIGKKMTIVGAGGAATAIEIQAALDGVAEITIFNRKDEFWDRAVSTVEKINTKTSCHAVLYDLADLDKLKEEMDERNRKILDVAFELFVDKKIEAVSMGDIARAADVGRATLFRYYPSKLELVIAVCADQWKRYLDGLDAKRPISSVHDIPAIDRLRFTMDSYIDMYQNHKALLKYNDNFNYYVTNEGKNNDQLVDFHSSLYSVDTRLHMMYEKARVDKTIRTDIPEAEFMRVTVHSMMTACAHYAEGFIWGSDDNKDYTDELIMIKEMIIDYATKGIK